MRTLPDGLDGAIMAVESIEDAVAFLHGPGGCRVRLMVHSTAVFPRHDCDDRCIIPYYNGYPRVPATYLDEYDYINGASYKLDEGLGIVGSREPNLVVTVDSPGASLIGDDHDGAILRAGMSDRALHIDSDMFSMPMQWSYGHTLAAVMEHLSPERKEVRRGTVILLGLTIMDKDWMDSRDELISYLEDMGLEVLCCPGAGASTEELKASVEAEYAVVVCPESCSGLLEYYRDKGVKAIVSDAGAPVGFDALRSWIGAVAEATGTDPSVPLERVEAEEIRITNRLVGTRYNVARIRGLTFSVAGISSVVRPLTEWLYSYIAMAPVAVSLDPGSDDYQTSMLREFLERTDYAESFGKEPVEGCDVVLSEGITAYTMRFNGTCSIGIAIGQSSMGLDDIIPRPVFGLQGVRYLLDELMHGVRGS